MKRKANHHRATTDAKHEANDNCKTNNKQIDITEQKTKHNLKMNSETAIANQNKTKMGF